MYPNFAHDRPVMDLSTIDTLFSLVDLSAIDTLFGLVDLSAIDTLFGLVELSAIDTLFGLVDLSAIDTLFGLEICSNSMFALSKSTANYNFGDGRLPNMSIQRVGGAFIQIIKVFRRIV